MSKFLCINKFNMPHTTIKDFKNSTVIICYSSKGRNDESLYQSGTFNESITKVIFLLISSSPILLIILRNFYLIFIGDKNLL